MQDFRSKRQSDEFDVSLKDASPVDDKEDTAKQPAINMKARKVGAGAVQTIEPDVLDGAVVEADNGTRGKAQVSTQGAALVEVDFEDEKMFEEDEIEIERTIETAAVHLASGKPVPETPKAVEISVPPDAVAIAEDVERLEVVKVIAQEREWVESSTEVVEIGAQAVVAVETPQAIEIGAQAVASNVAAPQAVEASAQAVALDIETPQATEASVSAVVAVETPQAIEISTQAVAPDVATSQAIEASAQAVAPDIETPQAVVPVVLGVETSKNVETSKQDTIAIETDFEDGEIFEDEEIERTIETTAVHLEKIKLDVDAPKVVEISTPAVALVEFAVEVPKAAEISVQDVVPLATGVEEAATIEWSVEDSVAVEINMQNAASVEGRVRDVDQLEMEIYDLDIEVLETGLLDVDSVSDDVKDVERLETIETYDLDIGQLKTGLLDITSVSDDVKGVERLETIETHDLDIGQLKTGLLDITSIISDIKGVEQLETVETHDLDIGQLKTGLLDIASIISDIKGVEQLATVETHDLDIGQLKTGLLAEPESSPVNDLPWIQRIGPSDFVYLVIPILAFCLWLITLSPITQNSMNDLGLVSALPPVTIIAFGILVASFVMTLQRKELRVSLLALHLLCIIIVIYGTPNLIEGVPHYVVVYKHAGYTDYILQTGTVNAYLDTYFNWPGFFILAAFFTKVAGYSTVLSYAGWAPVFYNVIYFGPMYMIFTSMTTNKRLVWLSLLFFFITNWVNQDYFSPQGLNLFLYLVIIAILLKWFRLPPKVQKPLGKHASWMQKIVAWFKVPDPQGAQLGPWQRRGLLCVVILVYGLIVCSHPLTPFFAILSVGGLVLFRRCSPFWLPLLMIAMTAAWLLVPARPYLSQNIGSLIKTLSDLTGNVSQSITTKQLSESALYEVIAKIRLYMTALVWGLAFLGGLKRWRQGRHDLTCIILALAGFPLMAVQSYGGEMLLRIYLFTGPFMVFFAAALFFDNKQKIAVAVQKKAFPWRTLSIQLASLFLLGAFLFTRYGDEHVDYVSSGEWNATQYLYQVAPKGSYILEAWNDAPLFYKDYDKYTIKSLTYEGPTDVIHTNALDVVKIMEYESNGNPNAYIIFSQEEQVEATAWSGLATNSLSILETDLLQTGDFRIVYSNSDTQILQFIGM